MTVPSDAKSSLRPPTTLVKSLAGKRRSSVAPVVGSVKVTVEPECPSLAAAMTSRQIFSEIGEEDELGEGAGPEQAPTMIAMATKPFSRVTSVLRVGSTTETLATLARLRRRQSWLYRCLDHAPPTWFETVPTRLDAGRPRN